MATRPYTYINGSTIQADENNANENELYSDIDPSNVQPANKTGSGPFVLGTAPVFSDAPQLVPIGAIIPFYDFDGAATFDPIYWSYCDGSAIASPTSPLFGQLTPDLSGRHLVGFGTDGGGDIASDAWATAAVGNSGNTINIQHSHTGGAHTHGGGTLRFQTMIMSGFGGAPATSGSGYDINGISKSLFSSAQISYQAGATIARSTTWANAPEQFYTGASSGVSASGGAVSTGAALSITQSIQPISIRVRFIIRVL